MGIEQFNTSQEAMVIGFIIFLICILAYTVAFGICWLFDKI